MNNNKPTEEQIKRFWEWCGFIFDGITDYGKFKNYYEHEVFYYPNSSVSWQLHYLPKIDLNNLFKWAVPKLRDKDIAWELRNCVLKIRGEYQDFTMAKLMWNEKAFWKFTNLKWSIEADKDPALALFWAIYKVMETK